MAEEYVVILTTLPADDDDAHRIARTIVEERLAACVNILSPMVSFYRWREEVQQEEERQVIIKTARRQVATLWERLRDLHPYDVPEFIVLPIVDGSDAYLKWIGDSSQSSA